MEEQGGKEDWRLEKKEGDREREIFRWCGEVIEKGRGWEGMGGQEDGKGGKTWQNWIILWGKEDKEKGKEWGVNKRTDGGDTRMLDGACGYYASHHGFCQDKPECVWEKERYCVWINSSKTDHKETDVSSHAYIEPPTHWVCIQHARTFTLLMILCASHRHVLSYFLHTVSLTPSFSLTHTHTRTHTRTIKWKNTASVPQLGTDEREREGVRPAVWTGSISIQINGASG